MIGLVLAGGGAKGAYQVGAWQALREQGIEFDVITGTSIGALNAALFAADDLDKAQSFWRSLSTARLARIEPLLLFGLLLRPLGLLARGSRSPQTLTARQLRANIEFGAIIVFLLLILAVITSFVVRMSLAAQISLVANVIAIGFLLLLSDISELVNGALISRRALFSLIDESIDWAKVAAGRPSVFVTLARLAHPKDRRKATIVIPDYARLSVLDTSTARTCLTASMALPFGIFPRIEVGSARYHTCPKQH
jgi:NTE family protein